MYIYIYILIHISTGRGNGRGKRGGGTRSTAVDSRTCTPEEVKGTIYIAQARCREPLLVERLRVIVDRWVGNGGRLQAQLAPVVDLDSPSALPKHKVLLPEFELRSKALC